jgi:hypothetical protein
MFVDLQTDDQELLSRIIGTQIKDGKAVRITLEKSGEVHHLFLVDAQPEPLLTSS